MSAKFDFYRRYGVEEYYRYDPDPLRLELSGFVRRQGGLLEVPAMNGHVSPRLGIRFEMADDGLRMIRPDARPLATYQEVARREEEERRRADHERQRAEQERRRADEEHARAELALRELEQLRRQLRPPTDGGT